MRELVIPTNVSALTPAPSENSNGRFEGFEFLLPLRARNRSERSGRPAALVTSSDEKIQQRLADWVSLCVANVFLAFTVGESKRILCRQPIGLIVSDDRLVDGGYQDLLDEANRLKLRAPLIVVSATGEWPEYLRAMEQGVFDYLAYPPLSQDFDRVIRQALASPGPISEQIRGVGGRQ